MRVGVLGATEAWAGPGDRSPVDLGTRKQRALLAALALHRGRAVSADALADLLWGDAPPAQAAVSLQGYVAGLRRALEPDRAPRAPATLLVTQGTGYALQLPPEALDTARFDTAVTTAHQRVSGGAGTGLVPPPAAAPDAVEQALAELDAALALWRGAPYADLEDAPSAAAERVRLEELRLVALEDRAVGGLSLGRHATVAAELEQLTGAHPLRERLWALRAVALARSGRQAEALEVLRRVRDLLVDELGLEPGAELRELQAAVLRQDPVLAWTPQREPLAAVAAPAAPVRAASGTAAPAAEPFVPTPSPWPMVGRSEQLASLLDLLDAAERGTPAFAAVTGEPGIGKSRLLGELAREAATRGTTVLLGRCSQDDGAPPLWPWAGVLHGLGRTLPGPDADPAGPGGPAGQPDEASRFRTWDDIVGTVRSAAAERPLVVLLDDLHWADVSSLRVLGLLLETVHTGRLLVVCTWRDRPPPTGALAAVAEQLSRRHALRLALHGLADDDVTRIVEAVAAQRPSPQQADALRSRTDGNPFFLVEYARLAGREGDLAALLAEPDPPHAVTDVVARRLSRLPDATRQTLVVAAVVGRQFDLATVAAAAGADEDRVLDDLDEATAAGLVREDAVGSFRFAHALVRDTVHATTSPTRRARWHLRVAQALADVPGREGEVARHWQHAGPLHAAEAWRAAQRAGRAALRVHAYDEATDLLTTALETLPGDGGAGPLDEHAVLVDLATAHRGTGNWVDLRSVVHRAVAAAERAGDDEAAARAALLTSSDALWQSTSHGEVDEVLLAALRRSLERVPTGDHELRCRLMLALAGELYYGVAPQEREALADEAVAMARRIGDPVLLLSACINAFVATWRPTTLDRRSALAAEALEIAERLGDRRALAYARTLGAIAASERGDVDRLETLVAAARRDAEEQRNLYLQVVLDTLDVSWLSMRGLFAEAQERIAHLSALGDTMALPQHEDARAGVALAVLIWQGRDALVLDVLEQTADRQVLPIDAAVLALLTRVGRLDEARVFRDTHDLELEHDTWLSLLPRALAAEAALALGDRGLGATTYRLLAPCADQLAAAGSGVALGPVAAYLAMAAAAAGEHDLAVQAADRAVELCRVWRVPQVEEWFLGVRDRHGF